MPSFKTITKTVITFILLLVILFLTISCKECVNEPKPEPEYNIYLSVEDVLCTWVTLNVTLPDSGVTSIFELNRNGCPIDTYSCVSEDTLVIDEGLIPDSDYYYKVRFLKDGEIKAESDSVDVHTMVTTSHAFVWEVDTIGDYGSVLYDVFAFTENEVWAVGEIVTDSAKYNIASWDGQKWELIRLEFNTFYGSKAYGAIRSIYAFDTDDVWCMTYFGSHGHWDGVEWETGYANNAGAATEAIWGSSSSNLYFVGNAGTIVHYNGTDFTRMESGTDADLNTIDGIYDNATGETHIWVTGVGILLYYDGSTWQEIFSMDNPIFEDNFNNPNAVYIPDDRNYIVSVWGGDNSGLYALNQNNLLQNILMSKHDLFVKGISGNSVNDFFMVGTYTEVIHYNGATLHVYEDLKRYGVLSSCYMIGDEIFAVGDQGAFLSEAIVFRGER